jgi:predicted nucleotidyltransferase
VNAEFFEPLSKQGLFYEPDFCDIVYRCPIRYDGLMQALSKDGQQMVAKIAEWCSNQPVKLCVLFGSQATGRQRPDSNVDLALWPSRMPLAQTKLTWLHELETLLDKPVNLALVSADLDPVLGFEIVRDGRLVYEQQSELWFKHRSQLWFAYTDSLPFRRAAKKQMQQFAEEVKHGS